jgi:hypothetical protein
MLKFAISFISFHVKLLSHITKSKKQLNLFFEILPRLTPIYNELVTSSRFSIIHNNKMEYHKPSKRELLCNSLFHVPIPLDDILESMANLTLVECYSIFLPPSFTAKTTYIYFRLLDLQLAKHNDKLYTLIIIELLDKYISLLESNPGISRKIDCLSSILELLQIQIGSMEFNNLLSDQILKYLPILLDRIAFTIILYVTLVFRPEVFVFILCLNILEIVYYVSECIRFMDRLFPPYNVQDVLQNILNYIDNAPLPYRHNTQLEFIFHAPISSNLKLTNIIKQITEKKLQC